MWVAESSAVTKAQAETVWNRWIDVATWSYWDKSVASAELEGSFKVGSHGVVSPFKGPRREFTITEVKPDCSFTVRSSILMTNVSWIFTVNETEGGNLITHRLEIQGLFSALVGPLFGRNLFRGTPAAVDMLARQSEVDELKAQDEQRATRRRGAYKA